MLKLIYYKSSKCISKENFISFHSWFTKILPSKRINCLNKNFYLEENLSPPECSKIAKGQEVVKLDFMISHKLSARVSRVSSRTLWRKATRERERSAGWKILIIPFTRRPDVSHIFILAEFDSSRQDYIGWHRVSGDVKRILTIILW